MSFLIIIRCQKTCSSKKILSALGMEYEKIDACKDNCMIFYKEYKNETECLKCDKSRFVEVVNKDSEKVTVGTLQTGYPYVQASSQDKARGVQPHAAMCPTASDPASQPRWGLRLPRVQHLQNLPPSQGGL
jgi:hypothetical protein